MTTRPDERTDQDQSRTGTEHGDSRCTEAQSEDSRPDGGYADPRRVDTQSDSRQGEQAGPGRADSRGDQRRASTPSTWSSCPGPVSMPRTCRS